MTNNSLPSLSVLVMDDDAFMLEVLVTTLTNAGIEHIVIATDGEEALAIIDCQDGGVDVVLCDLNMPKMDGIEFLRHVAERDFSGAIVLISGVGSRILKSAEALAKAYNLRILGSLKKPVTQKALTDMLSRIDSSFSKKVHVATELISEEELRQGIHGDELIVFYQPKVEVATRKIVGVESLVRWNHPSRGIVGPVAFISLAEQCGLIDLLTDVVFAKAMQQGGAWRSEGLDLKVAVNISVDNLNRFDFPEQIVSCAEKHNMNLTHVMLEVTESRLMRDLTTCLEILTRLCLKRISLSIDDFGTGYSSMEQLQRIPFSELKIDRTFVNGATQDPAARTILESSIKLAHELDMTTVAEGVEAQEDWDLVAQLGCDIVQGYFVAKPMPPEHLRGWIAEWYLGKTGAEVKE